MSESEPQHPATNDLEVKLLFKELDYVFDEIRRCGDHEVQNFQILITAVGAILASAGVLAHFTGISDYITAHPWVLLGVSIATFWFPVNALTIWADLAIAAVYLNTVLLPKLNFLAADSRTSTTYDSWLNDRYSLTRGLAGRYWATFSWEPFRIERFVRHKHTTPVMTPIWAVRSAFLFFPTGILLTTYVIGRIKTGLRAVSIAEFALWAIVAVLLFACIAAMFSTANVPGSIKKAARYH